VAIAFVVGFPIIGAILAGLYLLWKKFSGDSQREQQKRGVRQKLNGEIFPGIVDSVGGQVEAELGRQAAQLQGRVQKGLDEKTASMERALQECREKLAADKQEREGRLVCKCFGVTDSQILKAARENNLSTVEEVTNFTKAGGACGQCRDLIQELLDRERGEARPLTEIRPVRKAMSNIQRMQKIIRVIDEDIRPRLVQDGGDLELVDVEGNRVLVSMRGACASCRASQLTIKELVEKNLREQVDPAISVVEA
jgi:Fe-S cluster biogenesis protein NfuA/bacterioferritin-associated ferredoxin